MQLPGGPAVGPRVPRAFVALLLTALCMAASAPAAARSPAPDVRVLVDVSGSMRTTDPQGLRVPALQLLINLLPRGARAVFWSFGTESAVLVPPGLVDRSWREQAMQRIAGIGSPARYTDIADGLVQAGSTWPGRPGEAPRIMILLTDGQVDVDDDPTLDAESRSDILRRLVPRLRAQGVRLYTVGLSEAADQRLLEAMALETEGFSVVARNASDLLAAFLDIFSAALPANSVPVERQRFTVDASIRELTVLALHPHRREPVQLTDPQAAVAGVRSHPPQQLWLAQDTYTMVHVPDPQPGVWALAGGGPDTRVLVHSDLRLEISGLPAHALPGESFDVRAVLRDQGGAVRDPGLLGLLRFQARSLPADGDPSDLEVAAAGSGQVEMAVRVSDSPGVLRVRVQAVAGILHRSSEALVRVHDDAFRVEHISAADAPHRFVLHGRPEILSSRQVRVSARLRGADGASEWLAVESAGAGAWQVQVPRAAGVRELRFHLEGELAGGRPFEMQTPAQLFGTPPPSPTSPSQDAAGTEGSPPEAAPSAIPWRPIVGAVLVTCAALLLGVLGWARWRARAEEQEAAAGAPGGENDDPPQDLPSVVELTQSAIRKPPPP